MSSSPWRDEETLRRLVNQEGKSAIDIADEMGCANSTIYRWAEEYNISFEEKDRPWQDSDTVRELHVEQDKPTDEVADELGCNISTLHRWMKRHEIERQDQRDRRWRDEELLRTLYHEQDYSLKDIAEELECDKSTIGDWFQRHGIEYDSYRSDGPWRDEDILRELYHEEGMSMREVADELDCNYATIYTWFQKHNIEHHNQNEGGPWQDEEELRRLYYEEKMSAVEISEHFDCGASTIEKWMNRFEFERRDIGEIRRRSSRYGTTHAGYQTESDGYVRVRSHFNKTTLQAYLHRLLAVSEYGYDAVAEKHVHHKNHIPWDNRPENIELVKPGEHTSHHLEVRYGRKKPGEDT